MHMHVLGIDKHTHILDTQIHIDIHILDTHTYLKLHKQYSLWQAVRFANLAMFDSKVSFDIPRQRHN